MKIKTIIILFFFFVGNLVHGQFNDFGTWEKLSLQKKLVKNLDLETTFQIRFGENVSQVNSFMTDIDLSYNIYKKSSIFTTYRIGKKRKIDGFYSPFHRITFGLTTKQTFNGWKIGYRLKTQHAINDIATSNDNLVMKNAIRNKVSIKHKLVKKTWAWTSFEVFSAKGQEGAYQITDWRWKIGVDRKINKRQYLSTGFQIQKDLYNNAPRTEYIVFVAYDISLKKWFKKKKSKKESAIKE